MAKTKKITGNPEIDAIIGSLEKQFGVENFITLGPSKKEVDVFPSGCLALDIGLGVGGIPAGIIIEIFGPESSGKTSLALQLARQWAKNRPKLDQEAMWGVIADLEHTMGIQLFTGIGVNPDEFIFLQPTSGEMALQTLLDLVKSGTIGFVLLDSIDAIQTEAQLRKKMNEHEMGGASKVLNRFFREFIKYCKKNNTTAIFINQLKYNPGVMFGSPETTPGGTAPKFYSSLRLKTMPGKPSKDTPGAFTMRVKVIKNKVAPPTQDEITFDFLYAQGTDPYTDLVNTAKSLDIAYFGGSSFMVRWPDKQDSENLSKGGKTGAAQYLKDNPETYEKLRALCLKTAGIKIKEPENVLTEP